MTKRALTVVLLALACSAATPASAITAWGKRHLMCMFGSGHNDSYAAPEQVIAACDNLLGAEPDNIWENAWRAGRANALSKLGRCDEAISEYDTLLRKFFRASEAMGRGWMHRNCSNDFEKAIADFGRAIAAEADDDDELVTRADAYHARADTYFALGKLDLAKADYDEAIRIRPNYDSAYFERAGFYKEVGNYEAALKDYAESERLARLKPDEPSRIAAVYNSRALLWRDRGDYDRAMAEADTAVQLFPPNGLFRANRGELWRLKGDLKRALADQTYGVKNWSKNSVPLILRGTTLRYMGRYKEALADYDLALKRCPDCLISVTANRGLTFEKMGDLKRARLEFERAAAAGKSEKLSDLRKISFDTAVARLAALNSGAPQPVIPAMSTRVDAATSLATPAVEMPAPVSAPSAGRRVALVIGNSAYAVGRLPNSVQDGDTIAEVFKRLGFASVTQLKDVDRQTLVSALTTFAGEAAQADWAVVYYAGHAIELGGVNFLLPIDAKLASDGDVRSEAVPLDDVLAAIDAAKSLHLVFLDAGRRNPIVEQMRRAPAPETTASTPVANQPADRAPEPAGPAQQQAATLVFNSASRGQSALDGEGANSPFAVALAQRLATPGVEINKLLRLVRDDVMEATAGRQEPYTSGSLPGSAEYFFVAKP